MNCPLTAQTCHESICHCKRAAVYIGRRHLQIRVTSCKRNKKRNTHVVGTTAVRTSGRALDQCVGFLIKLSEFCRASKMEEYTDGLEGSSSICVDRGQNCKEPMFSGLAWSRRVFGLNWKALHLLRRLSCDCQHTVCRGALRRGLKPL